MSSRSARPWGRDQKEEAITRVRAALAAVLLACLLVPEATGHATGRNARLDRTRWALQRVIGDMRRSSHEADSVKGHIDRLNARLGALQIKVNRLAQDVATARSDARAAQSRIDSVQTKMDGIRHLALAQAVAVYEQGRTEPMDVLLGSKSLSELGDRMEMLDVAAQSNTSALVDYSRLTARIRFENQKLLGERNEISLRLSAREETTRQISASRTRLRSELASLRHGTKRLEDREKDLAAKSKEIKKAIARHKAMATVAALGVSRRDYIWPLNGGINSPYGPRWGSFHPGIDIDGYTGEPYMAAHSGKVITAGWIDGYGNAIIIDTGGAVENVYGHSTALKVSAGDQVKQGQVIGLVGCTGYCTGPHLHFEVRVNGRYVDPMPFLPNGSGGGHEKNQAAPRFNRTHD